MNYCTYCGASLEGAVNFCKNCGYKLDGTGGAPGQDGRRLVGGGNAFFTELKSLVAKHKRLVTGAGAGVGVAVLALVLVFAVFRNAPEAGQPLTVAEMLDLGEKYLLDLDYEQALVQFLAVIEVEPMNMRAYAGAAEANIGFGDIDGAIRMLQNGYEMFSDNPDFIAQSIELYENIINTAPLTAAAYINLSEIYLLLGDEDNAAEVLRRALAALPDNAQIAGMLSELENKYIALYADIVTAFMRFEDSGWTDYDSIPTPDSVLMFPDSKWKDWSEYAQNWIDIIFLDYRIMGLEPTVSLQFGLCDINSNGVKELIIGALYEEGSRAYFSIYPEPSILAIYTVADKTVLPVIIRINDPEDISVFDDDTVEHGSWGANSYYYGRYTIADDYSLQLEYGEEHLGGIYGAGSAYYDKDDNLISHTKARSLMSRFSNTRVPYNWYPLDHFFTNLNDILKEPAVTSPVVPAELSAVYSAYYAFLTDFIAEHGSIGRDEIYVGYDWVSVNGYPIHTMLFYAELIDFDADGIPELLLCHSNDQGWFQYSVYGYYQEVQLLVTDSMDASSGIPEIRINFYENMDGKIYLCRHFNGGSLQWGEEFSTLEDGIWVTVLTRFCIDSDWDSYFEVDGVKVDEMTYYSAFERVIGLVTDSWYVGDGYYDDSGIQSVLSKTRAE